MAQSAHVQLANFSLHCSSSPLHTTEEQSYEPKRKEGENKQDITVVY